MPLPTNHSAKILRVALPSPLRRLFDYLAPDSWSTEQLEPGIRISVPFGSRTLIGILVETPAHSELPEHQLKTALKQLDSRPILPPAIIKMCLWCADYYHHSLGDTFNIALPSRLRQGHDDSLAVPHWRCAVKLDSTLKGQLKRAPKQLAAFEQLALHPQGISKPLLASLNINSATLKALQDKQLVDCELLEPKFAFDDKILHEAPLPLNSHQQLAVDAVCQNLQQFHCHLLQGVTGSGKTEVYLHCIEQVLRQGKQALILIPEIGLTPQTLQRFRQRFNVPVAAIHSGLNDRERLEAWLTMRNHQAGILVGTRSSIFTPLLKPGLIIVDEEHDGSYKQQDSLRYNARDLAIYRAKLENIPIILGSATPSLESLHNAQQHRYQQLILPTRAAASAPSHELIDLRNQQLAAGISDQLSHEMHRHLQNGNQILLFLNRRGFAPSLLCHQCGWSAECALCDARMTLHRSPPHLHCHHCDGQTIIPHDCPKCHSTELYPVGRGTERCEEEISQLLPGVPLLRIDRDTTRRKDSMAQMLKQIQQGSPCILLGTQMLAKGHHFPAVTLVGMLDVDSGLFSTDFRGLERMGQLIVQVSGRAGRAERQGTVYIQTHDPGHPALQQLIHDGYNVFAQKLLQERQALHLPPYSHLALLRCESPQAHQGLQFLGDMRQIAAQTLDKSASMQQIRLLGPIAAPMERRQGRYRHQLLLNSPSRRELHQLTRVLVSAMESHPMARKLRWSVDIDPQEMA